MSAAVDGAAASAFNAAGGRFDRLDALRGVAIVWMALFHFCFDLNHFGFFTPKQAFTADPFWTTQRTCIVSLFLFCAGMGQAIALEQGQSWARFWRRWAQIAGCAVLVSIGSAWMFPRSWISFGVLHGIAVMLILVRWMAPLRRWLWPIGALAIVLPLLWRDDAFNGPWLRWIGLGHAQAGDRRLRAGAAVAGRDAVGRWPPGSGCSCVGAPGCTARCRARHVAWRCWGAGRSASTWSISRC